MAANELGEMVVRMRDVIATPGFGVIACSLRCNALYFNTFSISVKTK